MIYTKGLNIYSTLDSQAQKVIPREFKKKEQLPERCQGESKVEAAMVIVEVGTGKIKAMVGTRKTLTATSSSTEPPARVSLDRR